MIWSEFPEIIVAPVIFNSNVPGGWELLENMEAGKVLWSIITCDKILFLMLIISRMQIVFNVIFNCNSSSIKHLILVTNETKLENMRPHIRMLNTKCNVFLTLIHSWHISNVDTIFFYIFNNFVWFPFLDIICKSLSLICQSNGILERDNSSWIW